METVRVVYKNGYQLEDTQLIAINPYKIVFIRAYGDSDLAHILYCRNFDRREPCDDLYLTETYAAILAMCQGLDADIFNEYSVYINFVPGHGVGTWTALDTQTYNDLYIEDINDVNDDHEDPIVIRYNNVPTEVNCLRYCEGAFKRKKIYIEPVIGVTTTTTEESGRTTTTSTEEAVTTTSTEAGTTTTTTCVCTLWMLYNEDQTLITWTWTECNGREMNVEQEAEDEPIFVCSCEQPTCDGISVAVDTETPCEETPEVTTTTTEEAVTTTTTEEAVTTTTTEPSTTTTTSPIG